jgi:hypothetical protein
MHFKLIKEPAVFFVSQIEDTHNIPVKKKRDRDKGI